MWLQRNGWFLLVLNFVYPSPLESLNYEFRLRTNVQNITVHPDYGLDIYGFMKKYDYPLETHQVITEDGYILTLHRIPHANNSTASFNTTVKPAVLLQHGLGSSSVDWVNKGPHESLGQLLANAGWDVWLGNNRGTQWSRKHVKLNPDTDKEFWDFSFDECGYYDVPAMLDYIITKTGNKKVFYVGHSQGTSEFFAMASMRPEYNNKIALMSALAPVAHMSHITSPIIRPAGKFIKIMQAITQLLGISHIDRSEKLADFLKNTCSDGSQYQELCALVIYNVGGFNPAELDKSFLPVLFYNVPAGMSMKMMMHYGQESATGNFQRYDYGTLENFVRYGASDPPLYNISAISAPVALYYSTNDLLVGLEDLEQLAAEFQTVVRKYRMHDQYWTHLDYLWAKDLNKMLNHELVAHMSSLVKKYLH